MGVNPTPSEQDARARFARQKGLRDERANTHYTKFEELQEELRQRERKAKRDERALAWKKPGSHGRGSTGTHTRSLVGVGATVW